MSEKEKLHFKIGISGTYWDKHPIYRVSLNDHIIENRQIETASDEVFYIEFDGEIEEGPASLKIRLENKTDSDTIENEDKTAIVKDLLLNIVSVEIDEIDLGNLIYEKTRFVADDTNRPTLEQCVNLGWNGTWILEFESPLYIWLLENI
jgi:hypothetical protein